MFSFWFLAFIVHFLDTHQVQAHIQRQMCPHINWSMSQKQKSKRPENKQKKNNEDDDDDKNQNIQLTAQWWRAFFDSFYFSILTRTTGEKNDATEERKKKHRAAKWNRSYKFAHFKSKCHSFPKHCVLMSSTRDISLKNEDSAFQCYSKNG